MVVIFVVRCNVYVFIFCFLVVYVVIGYVKCEVQFIGISLVGKLDGKLFIEDGVVFILVDILVLLRFYGVGFLWDICIVFIMIVGNFKVKCEVD